MNEAEGQVGEEKRTGISGRGVRGRQIKRGKTDTRESMQQETTSHKQSHLLDQIIYCNIIFLCKHLSKNNILEKADSFCQIFFLETSGYI